MTQTSDLGRNAVIQERSGINQSGAEWRGVAREWDGAGVNCTGLNWNVVERTWMELDGVD